MAAAEGAALREARRTEIERLAAEEEDLARLIAELTSILSDYPITAEEPFSSYKGRLTWPLAGNLLHDFGQPRAGGLKWNGVVFAAPRGREVRAVYHGRVVFADWLAGMGLLVIVDHGDRYYTVCGHLDELAVEAGAEVVAGQVLGAAGETGSLSGPRLYFEIRRGAEALDPSDWLESSRTG